MKKKSRILLVCALALLGQTVLAQVPQIINYQGRIAVGGTNFNGVGLFQFALVNNGASQTYWSNGGNYISAPVNKGLYAVLLGDTSLANMAALPATVFTNSDVRLRVWFNDNVHAVQLLTPDQRIAAAGYALVAQSAQTAQTAGVATVATSFPASSDLTAARLNIGTNNTLTGIYSTVGGGQNNTVSNGYVTIAGGYLNIVSGYATSVGGGYHNTASGNNAMIGGGEQNNASGWYAVVGGGYRCTASGVGAFVGGGGYDGSTWGSNVASGAAAVVGGGNFNTASGKAATVGGGSGNCANSTNATVAGGLENTASIDVATVGGGCGNTASGLVATVGGGFGNLASAYCATVAGGYSNAASGDCSFAGGRQAKASLDGAFVWADCTGGDFVATAYNQVSFRASGGVRFFSNAGTTLGAQLAANATSWTTLSDRQAKSNIETIDTRAVLAALVALPVTRWSYKDDPCQRRYIGPMAQDFHAAFGLGDDDKRINTLDTDGVTLAAIQGLYQELQEEKARNAAVEAALEKRLADLERKLMQPAPVGK